VWALIWNRILQGQASTCLRRARWAFGEQIGEAELQKKRCGTIWELYSPLSGARIMVRVQGLAVSIQWFSVDLHMLAQVSGPGDTTHAIDPASSSGDTTHAIDPAVPGAPGVLESLALGGTTSLVSSSGVNALWHARACGCSL
jgi:hypothetical protein